MFGLVRSCFRGPALRRVLAGALIFVGVGGLCLVAKAAKSPTRPDLQRLKSEHHHEEGQAPSAELAVRILMALGPQKLSAGTAERCKHWFSGKAPGTMGDILGGLYFGGDSDRDAYFSYSCRSAGEDQRKVWACAFARFFDKAGKQRMRTLELRFDANTLVLQEDSLRCGHPAPAN